MATRKKTTRTKKQSVPTAKKAPTAKKEYLSSGSTIINLMCTDHVDFAFLKGTYIFIVGDSFSGKTWLAFTTLAEACRDPRFKNYRLIYDGGESGALMDIRQYFGALLAGRIEYNDSAFIEDFYYTLDDVINDGRPFIYIQDSMDVLSSRSEEDKFKETKKASRANKLADISGSYGDGKAKINSANLRRVVPKLKETGSILIILNQTRDNLGFGFEKKSRSGGHALKFYAHLEMWLSLNKKITRTINKKKHDIGNMLTAQTKKNRFTGKLKKHNFPMYTSFGFDDVGACVDYLVAEKKWKKVGQKIDAVGMHFKGAGTKEAIIRKIEKDNRESDLLAIVQATWNEIEDKCKISRKRRYE